jgi:hypothetical protein
MDNDCEKGACSSEAVQVVIGRRRSLQTFAVAACGRRATVSRLLV